MYASRLKPLAAVAVALSALLALGACGKKVDDASKPAATAPMTPSTTPSGSTASPPALGASGVRN